MLRLTELKLPLDHPASALRDAVVAMLGIPPDDLLTLSIARRGYDARRRSAISLVYAVDVSLRDEAAVLARNTANPRIRPTPDTTYRFPTNADQRRATQTPHRHRHRPLRPDGRPDPRPDGFPPAHSRTRQAGPRAHPRHLGASGADPSSPPNPTSSSARAAPAHFPTASSTAASRTPATSPANC